MFIDPEGLANINFNDCTDKAGNPWPKGSKGWADCNFGKVVDHPTCVSISGHSKPGVYWDERTGRGAKEISTTDKQDADEIENLAEEIKKQRKDTGKEKCVVLYMCNSRVQPEHDQPSIEEAVKKALGPEWDVTGADGKVGGAVGERPDGSIEITPPTVNGKPYPE